MSDETMAGVGDEIDLEFHDGADSMTMSSDEKPVTSQNEACKYILDTRQFLFQLA